MLSCMRWVGVCIVLETWAELCDSLIIGHSHHHHYHKLPLTSKIYKRDQQLESHDAFPMQAFTQKLDAEWEWPPGMNMPLAGDQELLSLSEQVAPAVPIANQPLECECEKVKCNCVKRCDCKLPEGAPALLQTQESLLSLDDDAAFLELEERLHGVNQQLDCDCDKVKCNCIKHCECAVKSAFGAAPGGAAALANLVQLNQATNCSSIEASEPKPTEGRTQPLLATPRPATQPMEQGQTASLVKQHKATDLKGKHRKKAGEEESESENSDSQSESHSQSASQNSGTDDDDSHGEGRR